ncbi:MAG: hypothetical protein V1492_04965 [Candidatus Micrarchaeota archaeon]
MKQQRIVTIGVKDLKQKTMADLLPPDRVSQLPTYYGVVGNTAEKIKQLANFGLNASMVRQIADSYPVKLPDYKVGLYFYFGSRETIRYVKTVRKMPTTPQQTISAVEGAVHEALTYSLVNLDNRLEFEGSTKGDGLGIAVFRVRQKDFSFLEPDCEDNPCRIFGDATSPGPFSVVLPAEHFGKVQTQIHAVITGPEINEILKGFKSFLEKLPSGINGKELQSAFAEKLLEIMFSKDF